MKIAMISPNKESEKALSKISNSIIENLKKKSIKIDLVNYQAGSPISFLKINL